MIHKLSQKNRDIWLPAGLCKTVRYCFKVTFIEVRYPLILSPSPFPSSSHRLRGPFSFSRLLIWKWSAAISICMPTDWSSHTDHSGPVAGAGWRGVAERWAERLRKHLLVYSLVDAGRSKCPIIRLIYPATGCKLEEREVCCQDWLPRIATPRPGTSPALDPFTSPCWVVLSCSRVR